jgi:predicted Zn-dependent protease
MALDPYSPCPCGSGKKFKWCCEPIYAGIVRAFEQEENGQHEAALRIMDQVIAEHGGNPEAWGKKAELLYRHEQFQEADAVLEKAFAINPNYPFGLWLRAMIRFQEGEVAGALLLARKAADAYDPQAHSFLAQVYALIFELEMQMNRPVAARAALRQVLHYQPSDEELRKRFDELFGEKSNLPASARREYALQSPPANAPAARRKAWDTAFAAVGKPRLGDFARIFGELTRQDQSDAAAWFNLAIASAWLGDNRAALAALDRYLDLETDETRAVTAATLMEVLRGGEGMDDDTDYHLYTFIHQITNPQPVSALIQEWLDTHRLIPLQTRERGPFTGMLLEHTSASLITVGTPAADIARLAGFLLVVQHLFQVSGTNKEAIDRLREEVRNRLALGLDDLPERRVPAPFQEVVSDALAFPLKGGSDEEASKKQILEHVRKYYEDTWIHRPRRAALAGNTPVDAAGHTKLRKKLLGVIQFIEDASKHGVVGMYDFNNLRRKLGLIGAAPVPHAEPVAAGAVTADINAMGAAELASLPIDKLSDDQLEQAYQTAHRLDASELTANFARALVSGPVKPERADRYVWYSYLTQHALKEGRPDEALGLIDEGERVDCEKNEGRRRNDYDLRRGQVHVKRGDADQAQDVFQRLIDRVPDNLKYRGSAAEAMLSLKQPARALRFAEEGVEAARKRNDRDSEHYLLELVAAARKQMG